jgi:hypothetical protein
MCPTVYPPTADVTGTRGSNTSASASLLVRQVEEGLAKMFMGKASLRALLSKTSRTVDGHAKKYEYGYLKDLQRVFSLTEAVADVSDDTLVGTSTAGLTPDMILQDPFTGEQMPIKSVDSATQVTVYRNRGVYPGSAAGAISSGVELQILAPAVREGNSALDSIGVVPTLDYNLFQQSEYNVGTTDIVRSINHYLSKPEDLNRLAVLEMSERRWEAQHFFGIRREESAGASMATVGGLYGRQISGGIYDYVMNWNSQSNVQDASGTLTYSKLVQFMREYVRPLNTRKFACFGSHQAIEIMQMWPLAYHQADATKTNVFGLDITTIKGPGWTLGLFPSEAFEVDGRHNQLAIIAADAQYIRKVTLSNLPDQWNLEITGPKKDGSHSKKDQWTGVHTLKFVPYSGLIIKNVDA